MEWINAECCLRAVILNGTFDPLGTVAGYQLNAFPLCRRQFPEEVFKHLFAETLGCPDHTIGFMVDDYGDVLVALLVGSFVNSDFDQIVKSVLT